MPILKQGAAPPPSEVILNRTAQHRATLSATFALTLVVVQVAALRLVPWEPAVRVILPATIAGVPLALWTYRRWAGTWVVFVGLAANLAVILANGGLMPIQHATVVEAIGQEQAAQYAPGEWIGGSKDVLVTRGHLTPLGDGIVVHLGSGGFVASPGDVVVWSGLLILAAEASVAWQRRTRPRRNPLVAPPSTQGATKAEGGAAT